MSFCSCIYCHLHTNGAPFQLGLCNLKAGYLPKLNPYTLPPFTPNKKQRHPSKYYFWYFFLPEVFSNKKYFYQKLKETKNWLYMTTYLLCHNYMVLALASKLFQIFTFIWWWWWLNEFILFTQVYKVNIKECTVHGRIIMF